MDIEINEVQEIIKNLESSGELSIKEEKYLKVARLCVQLAAENLALKESRNNLAEFIHEELDADYPLNMNLETTATDHIVAGIKADGVDMVLDLISHTNGMLYADSVKEMLSDVSSKLREGANHD